MGSCRKVFSEVHPVYRTPHKSNMLFFVFTGLFAAFIPEDIVGEMTSIGTLFAFILVCAGVWILRTRRPDLERAFRVPALPVVSVLGIVVCGLMIYGLGWTNWMRLIVWLVIGLVFYFAYGRRHSRLDAVRAMRLKRRRERAWASEPRARRGDRGAPASARVRGSAGTKSPDK